MTLVIKQRRLSLVLFAVLAVMLCPRLTAQVDHQPGVLNDILDISADFHEYRNTYFLADKLTGFDPATGAGTLNWTRNQQVPRIAFSNMVTNLEPFKGVTFPEGEYAINPALPFSIQFVSPRTVRIRLRTGPQVRPEEPSLMLVAEPPTDNSWKLEKIAGGYRYTSTAGVSVTVLENPWHVEFRDAQGRLLTQTHVNADSAGQYDTLLPFSFIRRTSDYSRSMAAVFSLSPGEKIFGCGESFTRLDKRGQKVVLWTNDANGVETGRMYKPIPFFMSNRGYGMFVHTSAPATFDFGASVGNTTALLLGDDALDLFVFLGEPRSEEHTSELQSLRHLVCRLL